MVNRKKIANKQTKHIAIRCIIYYAVYSNKQNVKFPSKYKKIM